MTDESQSEIQQIVVRAVQRAYGAWAAEHPTLASVIDRIALTEQAVESLRESQAFRDAVDAYHRDRGQLELLNRLIDLAAPILTAILAG